MSASQDQSNSNVVSIGASEAEAIFENLRLLRGHIITAWAERGVILSEEEQEQLHREILDTCDLLTNLTRYA